MGIMVVRGKFGKLSGDGFNVFELGGRVGEMKFGRKKESRICSLRVLRINEIYRVIVWKIWM